MPSFRHRSSLNYVLLLAAALLCPAAAHAQKDSWAGATVILTSEGVRIGHTGKDGQQIYVGELTDIAYQVVREENGWLLVRHGGTSGWFPKQNALLPEDAIDYFSDRISTNDGDAVALAHRARAWMEVDEPARALKDLNEALRLMPLHPIWLRSRGSLYAEKGEFDKALADLNESIRLSPRDALGYVERGIVYKQKKDYDKALADYAEAIRLDRQWTAGYYNRANVYRAKKEYDKAIADYSDTLKLDNKDTDACFNRGRTFQAKKEYAKAIADYKEVIRLDPKDAAAYDALAWLLATCPDDKVRDGKAAVDYAGTACEISELRWPPFQATLAVAFAEVGKFDRAVKWQKHALENADYTKEAGDKARQRLKLFEAKKPYREE